MKNLIIGFYSGGYKDKEVEVSYISERDFIKRCLIEGFGSEEECMDYWEEFGGVNNIEEVIDYIIRDREIMGEDEEYVLSEDGYFKIIN